MIVKVIVRPAALEDIAAAVTWYENQSPGLGEELADEVIKAIRCAQEAPTQFRIIRSSDEMRRALTKRFPYRIFFTVKREVLYVHAVLHGARHDRHWRLRS